MTRYAVPRPPLWRRVGQVAGLGASSLLAVGAVDRQPLFAVGAGLAALVLATAILDQLASQVRTDDHGIEARRIFGRARVPWQEVQRVMVHRSRPGSVVTVLRSSGQPVHLHERTRDGAGCRSLAADLEAERRSRSSSRSRSRTAGPRAREALEPVHESFVRTAG